MTNFIEFKTEDGADILVEVDEKELLPGIAKAGLKDIAGKTISQAQQVFEQAIKTAIRLNVETFYGAIRELPHPPTDVEISFGLKATGELTNFAISKIGAEANYTIKMSWRTITPAKQ
jgi:hypothetical protein